MVKSMIIHLKYGVSWEGFAYSLCTYSTKVICIEDIKYVTCKNCIKQRENIDFKKQLRGQAEDDIALLAKGMRKDNIIQITRACNQRWGEYERQINKSI